MFCRPPDRGSAARLHREGDVLDPDWPSVVGHWGSSLLVRLGVNRSRFTAKLPGWGKCWGKCQNRRFRKTKKTEHSGKENRKKRKEGLISGIKSSLLFWRRRRDLNPRGAFYTPYSLSRGAPSATWVLLHSRIRSRYKVWRREWDSNPRMLSHRRFSRPVLSTTQPSLRVVKAGPFPDAFCMIPYRRRVVNKNNRRKSEKNLKKCKFGVAFSEKVWYINQADLNSKSNIRVWRSLVSRLNGVQEASSSNLDTRTKEQVSSEACSFFCEVAADVRCKGDHGMARLPCSVLVPLPKCHHRTKNFKDPESLDATLRHK